MANTTMRRIALLLSLALLSGCVTTGTQAVKALPAGQSLAVVSALGDDLALEGHWLIQLSDNKATVEVEDWRIDDQVERQIESLIEPGGRFRAVDCRHDRKALDAAAGNPAGSGDSLSAVMQRLRVDCEADLYLVALPAQAGLFDGGYGPVVRGYGLYRRSFLGVESAVAHAFLRLYLFDRSGAEAIGSTLLREIHALDDGRALDPENFPPEQEAIARAVIERLLREHIPGSLRAMGMI